MDENDRKWQTEPIQVDPNMLEILSLMEECTQQIILAFGVPPEQLAIRDSSFKSPVLSDPHNLYRIVPPND